MFLDAAVERDGTSQGEAAVRADKPQRMCLLCFDSLRELFLWKLLDRVFSPGLLCQGGNPDRSVLWETQQIEALKELQIIMRTCWK